MKGGATIIGEYRYSLWRKWEADGVPCTEAVWVMLNPSTADGTTDDATIRRVMGLSGSWGFGACHVLNLFALRATDPRALARHPDPVGPGNDEYLLRWLVDAATVQQQFGEHLPIVAAWGANRLARSRGLALQEQARRFGVTLQCVGVTKDGLPRHPLYVKGDVRMQPWEKT